MVRPVKSKVHDVNHLEAQTSQVHLDCATQLLRLFCDDQLAPRPSRRTDFADQNEIVWIRRNRLADHLIDYGRPVVLGGIDVIDAEFDRLPQYRDRFRPVFWWTEHVTTGQSHRPKSDRR